MAKKNHLTGGIGKHTSETHILTEAGLEVKQSPWQSDIHNRAMRMSRAGHMDHREIMDDIDLEHPVRGDSADDAHLHKTIKDADSLDHVRDHIQDVLESHHSVAKKTGDYSLANHLTGKYAWAIGHKAKTETVPENAEDLYLKEDHIHKHTDQYYFVGARVLQHKDLGSYHELHQDGSVTPINNSNGVAYEKRLPFAPDGGGHSLQYHHQNLTALHKEHGALNIEPIRHYTGDSSGINQVHAALNRGKPIPDVHEPEQAEALGNHLRTAIETAPKYDNPMTVYTGLSRSSDPTKGEYNGNGKSVSHFPAFTSTSIDPRLSEEFGSMNATRKQTFKDPKIKQVVGDVMSIKIPANHGNGIYVEPHTSTQHEYEYIMKDNMKVEHDMKPQYYAKNGAIIRHWTGRVVE